MTISPHDLRLLFTDGTLTWGHARGNVEQEETKSKTFEETIPQSQVSLNHAQAMAHVGSWERDSRNGTMSWSDEMFRLCGLEPGSMAPSMEALITYTHPLDRQRAQEHIRQAMQEGKGAEIEVRLVGADGVLRYVFVCTEIFNDDAGRPTGARGTLTDVTERVKALQEQTKFVSLIENSSDFIAMASLDGVLLTINPAGRKLVGLERVEEVATTMLPDFMPAEVWDWIRHNGLPVVMRDDLWEGESQLVNVATGKIYDMQASFFLIRNPVSSEPMCLAIVQRDITDQKSLDAQLQQNLVLAQDQNVELEQNLVLAQDQNVELEQNLVLAQDQNVELELQRKELASTNAHLESANKRLEALATTDGLTGANNHRAFQEKIVEEFQRVERTQHPFSVILLDVDRFKQYNDHFGHSEGDRVLKQVVSVMQEVAREADYVARYGGEEFVVLLPETGKEGAIEAAERFRAAIEAQDWPLRQVTASFGVATLNASTETGQQLVDMADKALYVSKGGGRNRVTLADALPRAA